MKQNCVEVLRSRELLDSGVIYATTWALDYRESVRDVLTTGVRRGMRVPDVAVNAAISAEICRVVDSNQQQGNQQHV